MAEEDQKSEKWHAGWAAGSNAEHHQWNQKQIEEIERISINKQISVNTQKLHDKLINDILNNRKENDNG